MATKTRTATPRGKSTSHAAAKPRAKSSVHGKAKKAAGPPPPPTGLAGGAAAPWVPAAGEVGIRVRMYRVGFGDFFLISLLDDAGQPVHLIVDCGVFKGTKQTGDIGSIEAAVADMVQTTGGRVALIIMTHRHADHIAGFARHAAVFRTLTVDAVWMPIWESEYEPKAAQFQASLTRAALGLQRHFAALGAGASRDQDTAQQFMENALGMSAAGAAGGAGSNAVALDLLKHAFAGVTPSYYTRNDTAAVPKALADAGLFAQILGPPPIDDLDLMKLMDLQKNVGQYLGEEGEDDDSGGLFAPFGSEWVIQGEVYSNESFREWVDDPRKPSGAVTSQQAKRARQRAEAMLRASQPIAALIAATQLNDFLNNQSLVVLFTFKGKKLLFVGDAQAGNWEHWLFDTATPDSTASGTMTAAAKQILTSLDFYKVGHHGSSNATPRVVAETMGAPGHRFTSMCSTQADVYGNAHPEDPNKGTEVPRTPLLDKLASESALVRSDQIAIGDGSGTFAPKVTIPLPNPVPGSRLVPGTLWVDCFL